MPETQKKSYISIFVLSCLHSSTHTLTLIAVTLHQKGQFRECRQQPHAAVRAKALRQLPGLAEQNAQQRPWRHLGSAQQSWMGGMMRGDEEG